MNRLQRAAILSTLAEELLEIGSWCGETHLQKATFFLQHMLKVPTEWDFVLYRYGPFSFELRDELTAMRADQLLELIPMQPYGPRLLPTGQSKTLRQRFSKTLRDYGKQIAFVAQELGTKGVTELEGLATALFVCEFERKLRNTKQRVGRLRELKPHISKDDAKAYINRVDELLDEVQKAGFA